MGSEWGEEGRGGERRGEEGRGGERRRGRRGGGGEEGKGGVSEKWEGGERVKQSESQLFSWSTGDSSCSPYLAFLTVVRETVAVFP